MPAKLTRKMREAISSCSTGGVGTHYPSPSRFFSKLEWVLREGGFEYFDLEYPTIHTNEGRGLLGVVILGDAQVADPLFDVVFTWYRMPSGNWEMICYPTC